MAIISLRLVNKWWYCNVLIVNMNCKILQVHSQTTAACIDTSLLCSQRAKENSCNETAVTEKCRLSCGLCLTTTTILETTTDVSNMTTSASNNTYHDQGNTSTQVPAITDTVTTMMNATTITPTTTIRPTTTKATTPAAYTASTTTATTSTTPSTPSTTTLPAKVEELKNAGKYLTAVITSLIRYTQLL